MQCLYLTKFCSGPRLFGTWMIYWTRKYCVLACSGFSILEHVYITSYSLNCRNSIDVSFQSHELKKMPVLHYIILDISLLLIFITLYLLSTTNTNTIIIIIIVDCYCYQHCLIAIIITITIVNNNNNIDYALLPAGFMTCFSTPMTPFLAADCTGTFQWNFATVPPPKTVDREIFLEICNLLWAVIAQL